MRLRIIGLSVSLVLGLVPLISSSAEPADEFSLPDTWDPTDVPALQETVSRVMPQVVRLADEGEWNAFWTQVESVLKSQSLDDMAWMMASVDMTYEYVNSVPDAQPLALSAIADLLPQADLLRAGPMARQRRRNWVHSEDAWKTRLRDRLLPQEACRMIPQLKKVFDAEGVPRRWVWVAEVESSLNPRAKSPVGAVGLFQLMPETAQRFGVRTVPFDERVKPEKSARAAARYLKILFQQFGSWSLALAAYNAGEGRVSRMMKQHRADTFNAVAKHLPMETQMYVPKVMATVALREDQAKGVPYACRGP